MHRSRSAEGLREPRHHFRAPSASFSGGAVPREFLRNNEEVSGQDDGYDYDDDFDRSVESAPAGPVKSAIAATMRCKVFLQQHRTQWKALGTAKLKLYVQSPTNVKQLVVEGDKQVIISTIVLTDGVERVGKTGVAVELSDNGARTGIIYMLQVRCILTLSKLGN